MVEAAQRSGLSQQEYLELERASEQRHEYADGQIFAVAGATREHNLTAGNILGVALLRHNDFDHLTRRNGGRREAKGEGTSPPA